MKAIITVVAMAVVVGVQLILAEDPGDLLRSVWFYLESIGFFGFILLIWWYFTPNAGSTKNRDGEQQ